MSAPESAFHLSAAFLARFAKPRAMNTSAHCARNSRRIRTYQSWNLNSFRMNTYQKVGGRGVLLLPNNGARGTGRGGTGARPRLPCQPEGRMLAWRVYSPLGKDDK